MTFVFLFLNTLIIASISSPAKPQPRLSKMTLRLSGQHDLYGFARDVFNRSKIFLMCLVRLYLNLQSLS